MFLSEMPVSEYPVECTVMARHTGDHIDITTQFTMVQENLPILEAALQRAAPGCQLNTCVDMITEQVLSIISNPEHFRDDFELEVLDLNSLKNISKKSNLNFISTAAGLRPGEILMRDIVFLKDADHNKAPGRFRCAVRYLIVCQKGRRDQLLKSAVGSKVIEQEDFLSWDDYRKRGIPPKAIIDMFVLRRVHRAGFLTSAKELGPLFSLPWAAKTYKSIGIRTNELKGHKPHPELSSGLLVGYSLYDLSETPIHIPLKYLKSSIYLVGETQYGKSTFIEIIARFLMRMLDPLYTLLVIERKGELAEHLLGLVPEKRLNDLVNYFPSKSAFYCNILDVCEDPRSSAEFVSSFARSMETRHSWGVTPTAAFLFWSAIRALRDWGERVTLRHIKAFIADWRFRNEVLEKTKDPEVKDFVTNILPQILPASKTAVYNKLQIFLEKPLLSSTCQPKNLLKFNRLLKLACLIVANLSGLTYEQAADLGTFIFTRAASAAVQLDPSDRIGRWFTMIIDEFQEFINPSVLNSLLTQGRSSNINLIIAHQTLEGQLSQETVSTVLGNCPVKGCFRLAYWDARIMSSVLEVPASELANLEPYQAYLKVGVLPAVKIHTLEPPVVNEDIARKAVELSRRKFGAPVIDSIDPFALFDPPQKTTGQKKPRYNTLRRSSHNDPKA